MVTCALGTRDVRHWSLQKRKRRTRRSAVSKRKCGCRSARQQILFEARLHRAAEAHRRQLIAQATFEMARDQVTAELGIRDRRLLLTVVETARGDLPGSSTAVATFHGGG